MILGCCKPYMAYVYGWFWPGAQKLGDDDLSMAILSKKVLTV